jgi:DNA-binding NarL/FixJ family response regulator
MLTETNLIQTNYSEIPVKTINVAMADDHKLFAEGIQAMLNNTPGIKCYDPFINGKLLLNWYNGINADILLVDIEMPVLNGIETSKQLLTRFPDVKIIILSVVDDPKTIQLMLKIGVCAYLVKTAEPEDFIQTIFKVHAGEKVFPMDVLTTSSKNPEKINALTLKITLRETEILKLIIKGENNKKIADALNISPNTVKTHRQKLLYKLGANNVAQLIAKAALFGITL